MAGVWAQLGGAEAETEMAAPVVVERSRKMVDPEPERAGSAKLQLASGKHPHPRIEASSGDVDRLLGEKRGLRKKGITRPKF